MHVKQEQKWLSYHLYYRDGADEFLIQDVWPFVQELLRQDRIASFFFIRYNDQIGPHIRLRIKPQDTDASTALHQLVAASFSRLEAVAYTPEVERYGGPVGVAASEQIFEASSTAVLRRMTRADPWSYGQAIGPAIQLHLSMAHAFNLTVQEVIALCAHIVQTYRTGDSKFAARLEENSNRQKAQVAPQVKLLQAALGSGALPQEGWLATWHNETRKAANEIRRLNNEHLLRLRQTAAHQQNQLWGLYESYIHMTNNRLGISRPDEAFIAYVLKEALQ